MKADDSRQNRAGAALAAAMVMALALLAPSGMAVAAEQSIHSYGGNRFIVRKVARGQTVHLTLYRLAGDQWEWYAGTTTTRARLRAGRAGSLAERVYLDGRRHGSTSVDLRNPFNTMLNAIQP